jgi:hypothetical protein
MRGAVKSIATAGIGRRDKSDGDTKKTMRKKIVDK